MESKWNASFVPPCWFTNIEIIVTSRALNLPSQPSCHWHQNSVWEWSHQPWHRHCWHNAWKLYPFITNSLWWKGMHLQLTFPYPLSWSSHLFFNQCLSHGWRGISDQICQKLGTIQHSQPEYPQRISFKEMMELWNLLRMCSVPLPTLQS